MSLNLAEQNWERFLFDENMTIPMYYIIDWICRQKKENERLEAETPSLPRWHWMNLYPTVESEGDLFVMTDWSKYGLDESSWKEKNYKPEPGQSDFDGQQKLFDEKQHNFKTEIDPDPAFKMMYRRFKLALAAEGANNA